MSLFNFQLKASDKTHTSKPKFAEGSYSNQPWVGQGKAASILWDTCLEKNHDTGLPEI